MLTRYIVHDHESYYSQEYSLRKMTPPQYILDPRFEHIGCAVAENDDGAVQWLDAAQFREHLRSLRRRQQAGEKIVLVSHNALFDACLTAWRYGFIADLYVDTMSMARAMTYHSVGSVSLAKVAEAMGLGVKQDTILKVQGMGSQAIKDAGLWDQFAEYARNDTDLCRAIFRRLREDFPKSEFVVNDMVIRAAVQPRFKLDANVLAEHLAVTRASKDALLDRCGLTSRDELMSNDKFAEALRRHGVEPPTKISMTTGKATYAFAKTDQAMADLEEHENPNVQALVAARLGHKSTIEETRTERFLAISQIVWPGKLGTGWMPVPLRYSGAHTHRFSGDWKLNVQNLGRGSPLRDALIAPPGMRVVVADASQIEARIVAWLAGQKDLVDAFAEGRDIYSEFAGDEVFHRVVTKADKKERFVGKTAILGLGFGLGGPKFTLSVRTGSRLQLGELIDMDEQEGMRIVQAYRRRYSRIPAAWRVLNDKIIPLLARGGRDTYGPVEIEDGTVRLPSGLRLYYDKLEQQVGDGRTRWRFKYGREWKDLYGGKLFENLVQALARIIVTNAALTMRKRYPKHARHFALQVHDELAYVVPESLAVEFKDALIDAMTQPVPWAPGLPLKAEGDIGKTYGDAK